jgi:hypothetical protein
MSRNQQGVTAYKSGRWSEAEALFEQAMRQYPDDTTIKEDLRIAEAKVKSVVTAAVLQSCPISPSPLVLQVTESATSDCPCLSCPQIDDFGARGRDLPCDC